MMKNRLYEIRKKNDLSQEEMAKLFGVSRQTVQKWENGASLPEVGKLMAISQYFHVSLDFLLCNDNNPAAEEIKLHKELIPKYESIHSWELYSSNLMTEYTQCIEEGKDIEKLKALFEAVNQLPAGKEKEQLADVIFHMVQKAPQRDGFPYIEPSSLDEIQRLRPDWDMKLPKLPGKEKLRKKIQGAWIGRICGCLLGKTVEGIKTYELIPLLKETRNYPMHRYILKSEMSEDIYNRYSYRLKDRCFADAIPCAPVDDDTNYTVLAAKLIESFGRDFKPSDVARIWLEKQPKNAYCTAERVAFRNFVNGYMPSDSAEYKNPYREWIGAQIRGDYFGYINPGDPEKAAEMAWRDACISHVKNGIYGEMLIAAILAASAVSDDLKQNIRFGLSQIPKTSRLFEGIVKLMEDFDNGVSCKECFDGIHSRFDECKAHDWCHTISNAEIVVASLLYGNLDYGKSICLAVEAGFDTDCNGATVGSIIGMIHGIDGIPEVWHRPIKDQLDTSIFGVGKVNIMDMVDLTIKHIEMI